MWKLAALLLTTCLAACAGTSYGISTDGTFPPRPAGADYPNWQHMCVTFDEKNATEVLNKSADKGWELVTVGRQGSNDLMCFKRPKQAS